ncbi:MAG: ExeA family protein [Candidatus Wenzhouxiangella sp. M2_3B_020]
MYEAHFGLSSRPFGLTPELAMRYPEASQEAALEMLETALRDGEGFIKVVGEVGLGKTLLCRALLARLESPFRTAWLPDPMLSPGTLRAAVARELGIDLPGRATNRQVNDALQTRLTELAAAGERPVVLIDEAQALPDGALEAVRLLTNLETERRKLLQVVLFAQPELDARLSEAGLRQLAQRVTFSARLAPLGAGDVAAFIRHRVRACGQDRPLFTRGAVRRINRASRGVPRLVNILCHKSLLAAYGLGKPRATWREAGRAIADTESVRPLSRAAARWLAAAGGPVAVLPALLPALAALAP